MPKIVALLTSILCFCWSVSACNGKLPEDPWLLSREQGQVRQLLWTEVPPENIQSIPVQCEAQAEQLLSNVLVVHITSAPSGVDCAGLQPTNNTEPGWYIVRVVRFSPKSGLTVLTSDRALVATKTDGIGKRPIALHSSVAVRLEWEPKRAFVEATLAE